MTSDPSVATPDGSEPLRLLLQLPDRSVGSSVQGGLDPDLRATSIQQLKERNLPGYAIGGLAGGEDKHDFWRWAAPQPAHLKSDATHALASTSLAIMTMNVHPGTPIVLGCSTSMT